MKDFDYTFRAPDVWFTQQIARGRGVFDRPSFEAFINTINEFKGEKVRTIVDVGAHVGSWTLPLSEFCDKVIAFEPMWYQYLSANLQENGSFTGKVETYRCAIGSRNGAAWIAPGAQNSGQAHIVPNKELHVESQEVTIRTLNRLFADRKHIDAIKIDVEGQELQVLLGASEVIERWSPVILLELNGLGDRYGTSDETLHQVMKALDYQLVANVNKDYIFARKL